MLAYNSPGVGGADRDRTDDLRLAKPALSQLSYSPVLVRSAGEAQSPNRTRRAGFARAFGRLPITECN